MDGADSLTAEMLEGLDAIDRAEWDACAGSGHPFVCYDFLQALEAAGCIRAETGWLPRHLVIRDEAGRALAVMPLYLKGHSQGEYVFDHGWADAYERAGGRYYPKLLSAVPFSPVTGPRLLVRPDCERATISHALGVTAARFCAEQKLSSLHVNFLPERDARTLGDLGYLLRNDQQFHWHNRGYQDFDAFLDTLASRKRKAIRKERREALSDDISIDILTGDDICEAHWDAYFEFYLDTGSRKWGRPYLNREFFSLIGERIADQIALIMCRRAGRYIAGALNLIGDDTLYGRYWGCIEDHRFLHFETCYYQAIDFAIARGLARVEAGAQGQHKLARGYVPTKTWSAHFITDPGFRSAVARFLDSETEHVDIEIDYLARHAPYRKG